MALLSIASGTVYKSGQGKFGPWMVVREKTQTPTGKEIEVGYMCELAADAEIPVPGAVISVIGRPIPKVNDSGYPEIKLWEVHIGAAGEAAADPDEEIPF